MENRRAYPKLSKSLLCLRPSNSWNKKENRGYFDCGSFRQRYISSTTFRQLTFRQRRFANVTFRQLTFRQRYDSPTTFGQRYESSTNVSPTVRFVNYISSTVRFVNYISSTVRFANYISSTVHFVNVMFCGYVKLAPAPKKISGGTKKISCQHQILFFEYFWCWC